MLFLFNTGYDMSYTADAKSSTDTDSLRAVIVTSGRFWARVSFDGDTVVRMDIRTSAVIADAKVRKSH